MLFRQGCSWCGGIVSRLRSYGVLWISDAGIEFAADLDVVVGKLEAAEATLEAAEATLGSYSSWCGMAILEVADGLALWDGVLAILDDIPESMRCIMHKARQQ